MSNELMSHDAFGVVLSIVTGVIGGLWVCYDLYNLSRQRGLDPKEPAVHDKRFGFSIGILMGLVGVIGTLRFNDVL